MSATPINETVINEAQVWQALAQVKDPEIPVLSLVDMGIIRELKLEPPQIHLSITPTFSGCPALHVMKEDIKKKLTELGFSDIHISTLLSPAWSSDWISESGKAKLKAYGIAPPAPNQAFNVSFEEAVPCPRCQSLDTSLKNSFGSTLCKMLYYCHNCQEPFEAFKSV
ncbi:MAG: 1,2-phenylacetyl-CoA epoxidase subunit PaaD [Deinococcales bacterium]